MNRIAFLISALTLFACGDNIRLASDGGRDSKAANDGPVAMCAPNAVVCAGDDLVTCDANGNEKGRTSCALGCDGTGAPARCKDLWPTNLDGNTCDQPGTATLAVAAGMTMTLDTTDANCDEVITQPSPPNICVKKYSTVMIASTGTLATKGPNALAIVATMSLDVAGTIDASATATADGPGGNVTAGRGGTPPSTASAGGGGAGYLTDGGAGAVSSLLSGGVAGTPGMMSGNAQISPARGGARGGSGGPNTAATPAAPGLSGGYLQLVSCNALTIENTAILDAGGGGGGGGNGSLQVNDPGGGGGGGGAGGSILIEAVTATIAGGVFANGGGGGGGGAHGLAGQLGASGNPGQHGTRSTAAAMGGAGVIIGQIVTGAGGNGGALSLPPTGGGQPTANVVESSGGGGGAAGRLRINVKPNATPTLTGATFSPLQTTGTIAIH